MSIFEQLMQILVEPFISVSLVLIVACVIGIFAIIGSARVEEQGGEQFQPKPRPARTE
jgi:hypothetical protein